MCAAGSHEITFEPSGNLITSSATATVAIRLRCVTCAPLGGPVVPEV